MSFLFFKKNPKASDKPAEADSKISKPPSSPGRIAFKTKPPSGVYPAPSVFKPPSSGSFPVARPPSGVIRDHQMSTPTVPVKKKSEASEVAFTISDVKLTLETLLDSVPPELLSPAAGGVDSATLVSVPLHNILPQLAKGRITLPLSELLASLPPRVLVSPLPFMADRNVELPLSKVIPQLPRNFFDTRTDQQSLAIEDSFLPTPFGEDPYVKRIVEKVAEQSVQAQAEAADAVMNTAPPVAPRPPAYTSPVEAPVISPQSIEPPLPPVVEPPAPKVEHLAPAGIEPPAPKVELPVSAPVQPPVAPVAKPEPPVPADFEAEAVSDTVTDEFEEELESVETDLAHTESLELELPVTTREVQKPAVAEKPLTPAEQHQFLIDINGCSVADLTRIPGVGPALAQRIIAFRDARGRITDINELRQVPGVGNKTFRRLTGTGPAPRGKIVRLVNYLLDVPQDQSLNLQSIVRLTGQLPGVQGCIMAMEDGLFVTGHLPPSLDNNTVSAFAPQLFRRVSRYVRELQVGRVRRFSLFAEEYPVSIFHAGRIYLIVIHAPNMFSKSLLRRCERITQEINRMCTERVGV